MYFIDISQCPHTADTIGYNFFPFNPLNATLKYCPSTMKLIVPSSISSATMNLSGTRKVSSGLRIAGYVTPVPFFESWYNLFRPKSQPQLWSVEPTRLWYPTLWSGASRVATPTTACVPRWRVDQFTSHTWRPFVKPTLPRIQSVLCATGCRWNVNLSSSFTNTFKLRSSAFHECLTWTSRATGGISRRTSNRAGRVKKLASSRGMIGLWGADWWSRVTDLTPPEIFWPIFMPLKRDVRELRMATLYDTRKRSISRWSIRLSMTRGDDDVVCVIGCEPLAWCAARLGVWADADEVVGMSCGCCWLSICCVCAVWCDDGVCVLFDDADGCVTDDSDCGRRRSVDLSTGPRLDLYLQGGKKEFVRNWSLISHLSSHLLNFHPSLNTQYPRLINLRQMAAVQQETFPNFVSNHPNVFFFESISCAAWDYSSFRSLSLSVSD